jgi:hypothetical protein
MWMKQNDELSAFYCLSLCHPTAWNNFELSIQCVLLKAVVLDDTKCFGDFYHLEKIYKRK